MPPISSSALVDDLMSPRAYPVAAASVERVETHASWVFLTPRDAWKVKRPVDHGFLDFTTAEKRRRFCEEEVRLNRRLAPGVYLGVVPVRRGPRGHAFVGPDPVVDYAVRMRRLPDERSAESMLARGALEHAHLEALARRLAEFYASARETPAFGDVAVVAGNVRENVEQTRPFAGGLVDAGTFDAIRRAQEEGLARAPFAARGAAGRIREGHGDLRLEHVYFPDGEPVVIDCIEFNERFRCGDQASDVAFLAMELEARGRRDLAEFFLARFALEAHDHDLYSVVDFYLVYRAWVRGKVACFVAADAGTEPSKAARKAAEAAALFALARRLAEGGAGERRVVAVGGIIGSGKSTLSDGLCRALAVPVVRSDATRKRIAGLAATDRGGPELYTPAMGERTFDEVFRLAEVVLASGRGVILDASFSRRELRRRARELASRAGAPFLFAEARCDEAVARERLKARERGPQVSDAREDLYAAFRAGFEPADELAPGEHVVVDTGGPPAGAVAAVLKAM